MYKCNNLNIVLDLMFSELVKPQTGKKNKEIKEETL